jgi:transposase InsO family protein
MQNKAENLLNPYRYNLSDEAKKRLRWLYVLYHENSGNVSRTALKIGITRKWLSTIKAIFEKNDRDPRSLEPSSRAPHNTSSRKRILKVVEDKIVAVRSLYPFWGKDKIQRILKRDYLIKVGASTVNRYLQKHHLIDPGISAKNKLAVKRKKDASSTVNKFRPPNILKDFRPGALIEKDMKLILKPASLGRSIKHKAKNNFWYQHTIIDSFTRLRTLDLTEDCDSKRTVASQQSSEKELPFKIACLNSDNGGENEKHFNRYLIEQKIFHFFSRPGTPTDNPRVERSHLTDDLEFYSQGNLLKNFQEQKAALKNWEYVYNYVRPHQALGQLTPFEFFRLWKKSPAKALKITDNYQKYLKKQSKRLAQSRLLKGQQNLQKLMLFIDQKLSNNSSKKCELCSWT